MAKQDRSSWTREQIEHELDSSLKLYDTAMKQYINDQDEILRLRTLLKESVGSMKWLWRFSDIEFGIFEGLYKKDITDKIDAYKSLMSKIEEENA
jgi:hypothetical protein